jgi:hypothetical protein
LLADQSFEGSDPRLVLLDQVGGGGIFVKGASLVSLDPDPDQIA